MAARRARRGSGPSPAHLFDAGQVTPPSRAGRWLGGVGTGPLDRPGGLPPCGSRYGMLGLMGLGLVTPMMGGMALYALRGGLSLPEPWLFGLFWGWVILLLGSFIGLTYRRFWGICLGWSQGLVTAIAFPLALAAAVPIPLGLVGADGDRRFLAGYALGWLLAAVPLWPLLVRMLRLRFWQPWRRRDEWEPGDEPVPRWALIALDHTRPWLADQVRQANHLPERPPPSRWLVWLPWVFPLLVIGRVLLLLLG